MILDIIIFLIYYVMVKNLKSSFDLGDTKEYQWPSARGLSFLSNWKEAGLEDGFIHCRA